MLVPHQVALAALVALSVADVAKSDQIFLAEAAGGSKANVAVEEKLFLDSLEAFGSQNFDEIASDDVHDGVVAIDFDSFVEAEISSTEVASGAPVKSKLLQMDTIESQPIVYLYSGTLTVDFAKPVDVFAIRGYFVGPLATGQTSLVVRGADGSKTSFTIMLSDEETDAPMGFFLGVDNLSVAVTGFDLSNPASGGTAIQTIHAGSEATAECHHGVVSKNGRFCCNKSCGSCGGCDCATRIGGALECCPSSILETGVPCITATDTGCVLHGWDNADFVAEDVNRELRNAEGQDSGINIVPGPSRYFDDYTDLLRAQLGASLENDGESECP